MTTDIHIVCACGAEADCTFQTFEADGTVQLERRVCRTCGECLQDEVETRNAAHCELVRQGLDERMAKRAIDTRIDRGELLPTIAEMLRDE